MNEIIYPHCKKAFTIDEAGYADILQHVRDHAFEKAIVAAGITAPMASAASA